MMMQQWRRELKLVKDYRSDNDGHHAADDS